MKSTILVAGASGQTAFGPLRLEQTHDRAIVSNLSGFRRRGGDRHFRSISSPPDDIFPHRRACDLARLFLPFPRSRLHSRCVATAAPPSLVWWPPPSFCFLPCPLH